MKNIFLLLLICFMFSCKKEDNHYQENSIVIDTLVTNSFEYKYKNEPKYFMGFWKDMSKEDFIKAKGQLKDEGVLDCSNDKYGNYYDIKIGENFIVIDPIIENNVVIGVKIPNVNENIYKLYEQKYNLPKLTDVSIIGKCYKEVNPCFLKDDCEDYLKINKNIKEVSLEEVKNNTVLKERFNIYTRKDLPENRIRIENEKCNIVIRNNTFLPYTIPISCLIYDCNHSEENTDFYYPIDSGALESLDYSTVKKSKFRYVVTKRKIDIEISYFPNDYFSEQEKKQNEDSLKQDRIKKKENAKQIKLLKEI